MTTANPYAAEGEARWGDTPQWEQSQRRTSSYDAATWARIHGESDAIEAGFAVALVEGEPATGPRAHELVLAHRAHIDRWFYDCPAPLQHALAQLYVEDPRFAAHYDGRAPGLAAYVSAAILAAD